MRAGIIVLFLVLCVLFETGCATVSDAINGAGQSIDDLFNK